MNLAALASAAFRLAPSQARGSVVFTNEAEQSTTGVMLGVPGRAGFAASEGSDGFRVGAAVSDQARRLVVLPDGLTFVPSAGHTARFEGLDWNVLGVSPLMPDGVTVVHYRVMVSR